MLRRHPQADTHLLDHLVSLEAFLDKSILFVFSFRINKAEVVVAEGKLLGHRIGRDGSSPDEERCHFPPLREKLHIQQFLGCANSKAPGRSSLRAAWAQAPLPGVRPSGPLSR